MNAKQEPPFSLRLPNDLREYLMQKSREGYRSLAGEITMRLDQSRKADMARAAIEKTQGGSQ